MFMVYNIALHINICFTCHYVHVQALRIFFLSANLLCSAMSLLFFAFLVPRWLDSIGSSGISMISDSLGFGLGVCVCVRA